MSQVSWNKPAALAATLFVLASAVYWLEFKHAPSQEEAEERTKKLYDLKDRQVKSILITDGVRRFSFSCLDLDAKLCKPGDNSKWELTEPSRLRADDSNVSALVSALNNTATQDTVSLAEETPAKKAQLLKDYKLDPESRKLDRRVEVVTADGQARVLWLGDNHPVDGIYGLAGTAASPDESRALIVPTYFKTNFDRDLTYWRDKKILGLGAHQIQEFQLESEKGRIDGFRRDGKWWLRSGSRASASVSELPGDLENIDNLLSAATFLTARSFKAEKKDTAEGRKWLSGAKRRVLLILKAEKQEPVRLEILQKDKTALATVSGLDPVYEVEEGVQNRLGKDLKSLRLAKLMTSVERFSARRLVFEGKPLGSEPLTLTSQANQWTSESAGKHEPIKQDKVQTLLDRLSGNRIQDFLEGPAIPAGEKEGLRVTLGTEKEPSLRQLVFWKGPSADQFYARDLTSPRKEAFRVDTAIRDALPWARDFFR
jgi:hypothetical protein